MGKLTFGQTGRSYEAVQVVIKVDGAPKCPKCDKIVYVAEERKAVGKSWHAKCLTCDKCSKSLVSGSCSFLDEQLLCQPCYKKASTSKPTSGGHLNYIPPNIPSSPGINHGEKSAVVENSLKAVGAVSSQEYVVEIDRSDPRGSTYTEILTTSSCHIGDSSCNQDSGLNKLSKINLSEIYTDHSPTFEADNLQSEEADISNKLAEASSGSSPSSSSLILAPDFDRHSATQEAAHSNEDDTRSFQRFYSAGEESVTMVRSDRGAKARARFQSSSTTVDREDRNCCPSCGRRVYVAEEITVRNRKWHRACFKCGICQKTLVVGKYNEHELSFYCQHCYNKNFGPRGYGRAGGSVAHYPSISELSPGLDSPNTNGSGGLKSVDVFIYPTPNNIAKETSMKTPLSPNVSDKPRTESVTMNVTQPIRGTQEWTEAVILK